MHTHMSKHTCTHVHARTHMRTCMKGHQGAGRRSNPLPELAGPTPTSGEVQTGADRGPSLAPQAPAPLLWASPEPAS